MLTLDLLNAFLTSASAAGWQVRLKESPQLVLPPDVATRYPHPPTDYALFLSHVAECVNAKQNAWILTETDFNAKVGDESTFHWNEWERMGLEAFQDDLDVSRRISQFWTNHIPLMSAVHSDYAYIALRITDGAVVYGYGPEFEDSVADVCGSFAEYLAELGNVIAGRSPREVNGATRRQYTDFL
jgi:hypothetical protein